MQNSIKKNYMFNLIYQVLNVFAPFITAPYISRVLTADGIGTYSYAESVVFYFTLFASVGTGIFGQREISYCRDDLKKRSVIFWNIVFFRCISVAVCLFVYGIFVFFQEDKAVYFILSVSIISVAADITWFFQGLENFRLITIRNFVVKLGSIGYLFLFVKNSGDLNVYIAGVTAASFLGGLFLWFSIPEYIEKADWKKVSPFSDIHTIVSLFIPTIATSIYTMLDKTMIGVITGNSYENGYYEQAIKIARIVLMVVTSFGTVMVPRIGYYVAKGENETIRLYMYKSYRFVWFLGIPMCFGLIVIAPNFVPWFFGAGYEKVIPLISILSFLILAIGINNVTGLQYLIPSKKQVIYTFTVIIGAIVNLMMNMVLIGRFQSVGAAIASVAAESVIAIMQLWIVRFEINLIIVAKSCIHYLISGLIMMVIISFMGSCLAPALYNTVLIVVCGGIVYVSVLLIMKDDFFMSYAKLIVKKIRNCCHF